MRSAGLEHGSSQARDECTGAPPINGDALSLGYGSDSHIGQRREGNMQSQIIYRSLIGVLQMLVGGRTGATRATRRTTSHALTSRRIALPTGVEIHYVEKGEPEGDVLIF